MHTIYLDNAATSFPKPPCVGARMREYVDEVGASVGRGSYAAAQQAERVTLRLRQRLGRLFGFADPRHVILTPGNTWGLNLLLAGALRPGDHVLVSAMEHNAVMRPLTQLAKRGVTFGRIPCDAQGRLQTGRLEAMLRPNTRLVLLAHASNVSGTVQDAQAVGAVCAARGVPFALDAAQTAGHLPLDFAALQLSALSVPGHKGLLGPQGTGALLLRPDFAKTLEPIVSGGTGSASDSEEIPAYFPDRLEPGTPNLPGIFGWEAALGYLEDVTFTDDTYLTILMVYAAVGNRAYEQDEPFFEGQYDVTYRMPLVPNDGTYELRIAVGNGSNCGMMQTYFGTNKNNLSAVGLPLDMRYVETTDWIQYFLDTEDRQENARLERNMRNHNVMKGSNCYGDFSYGVTEGGRNSGFGLHKLRHIVYRGPVRANTRYYLRFKNVLNNPTAHLDIDYIEWVPKSVYDGVEPEDYY